MNQLQTIVETLLSRADLAEDERDALLSMATVASELAAPRPVDRDAPPTLETQGTLSLLSGDTGGPAGGAEGGPAGGAAVPPSQRLKDEGLLGLGGIGEVRRVRDAVLQRSLALKVLRPGVNASKGLIARFIEEAQVTAQLDHPGVLPVHELGLLDDGRVFYTMKELRGRPLREHVREVRAASTSGRWAESPSGWSLRRLVGALQRAAEAVAYAHRRGVVHRDLKPSNIMTGDLGEVYVLDWGLAKVLRRQGGAAEDPQGLIHTVRTEDEGYATRLGAVAGTLAFMPPEQALGQLDLIDPSSDVFALGGVLYFILTGRPPLEQETHAPRQVAPLEGPLPIPQGLRELCERALSWLQVDRYPDGAAFAEALGAWLDGTYRRERALSELRRAQEMLPNIHAAKRRAGELEAAAASQLESLRTHDPVDVKRPAWQAEDEARALREEAELGELDYVRALHEALTHDAELPEARAALATFYRAQHQQAEVEGDRSEARRSEALLRAWDAVGAHSDYLKGEGSLTLLTDPPAQAWLRRYELVDRRLVAGPRQALGVTPLREHALAMGAYVCELEGPGGVITRYPVRIDRQQRWEGPPVWLPGPDDLDEDEVYVPGGPFLSGGDPEVLTGLPREVVELPGFVIQRFPVTNRDYLAFLNDLLAQGREAEALALAPRLKAVQGSDDGPIYGRDEAGDFILAPDAEGDTWDPDWPVCLVDWDCGVAYAEWLSARTGRPWRLPTEGEWEKAARGVDGRFFPWGDFIDPTWACCRDSHHGAPLPRPVQEFPIDESPYGARGLAGNMRDWCALDPTPGTPWHRSGAGVYGEDSRPFRGGSWDYPPQNTRSAFRYWSRRNLRAVNVGLRLVRSAP